MNAKRTVVAATTAFLLIGGGTAAYAYWTTGGSGTGTATTGTTQAVNVNQTATIAATYPGQGPQALAGNFNNPNSGPVKISSVTATVRAFTAQADGTKPACTASDFAITGTSTITGSGPNNEIPSGNAQGSWNGLSLELLDSATNQENCKSVTVTIDYVAS